MITTKFVGKFKKGHMVTTLTTILANLYETEDTYFSIITLGVKLAFNRYLNFLYTS